MRTYVCLLATTARDVGHGDAAGALAYRALGTVAAPTRAGARADARRRWRAAARAGALQLRAPRDVPGALLCTALARDGRALLRAARRRSPNS